VNDGPLISNLGNPPAADAGIGVLGSATICVVPASGDDATVTRHAVAAPEN
jgi:hypothetical protein